MSDPHEPLVRLPVRLSEAQREGRACVCCGREDGLLMPIGCGTTLVACEPDCDHDEALVP